VAAAGSQPSQALVLDEVFNGMDSHPIHVGKTSGRVFP
jgi:hypothetical protein